MQPAAISLRNSMSRGLTRPEMAEDFIVLVASDPCFKGQFPAPWQLKTPTTPDNLFKFQIFNKLQQIKVLSHNSWQCERPGNIQEYHIIILHNQ